VILLELGHKIMVMSFGKKCSIMKMQIIILRRRKC
jgi:hypothetical protein